jgi:hypothetical protein
MALHDTTVGSRPRSGIRGFGGPVTLLFDVKEPWLCVALEGLARGLIGFVELQPAILCLPDHFGAEALRHSVYNIVVRTGTRSQIKRGSVDCGVTGRMTRLIPLYQCSHDRGSNIAEKRERSGTRRHNGAADYLNVSRHNEQTGVRVNVHDGLSKGNRIVDSGLENRFEGLQRRLVRVVILHSKVSRRQAEQPYDAGNYFLPRGLSGASPAMDETRNRG